MRMLPSSASRRSSQRAWWVREVRLGRFCKRAVEQDVAAAHVVFVSALGQPFERVLAYRPQHSEARVAAGHPLCPKQAVVQERLDTIDDV